MTHDELLADINKEIDQAAWTREYYPFKSLQALRAVVELHKPKIEIMENDYGQKEAFTWCIECPDGFWDEHPCPTIQAIEKELS